jgi:imidazolonepropionase-like amidohydrolase
MPLREDDPYDQTYALPGILHRAGVRFCLGYESYAGTRNLPFQAGQAAAYGLPLEEALRSVTLSPAEILGVADQLGSLEIGKAATIVVSDGDLLDNRTNSVLFEFMAGRKVDLDSKHKELYRKYRDRKVSR